MALTCAIYSTSALLITNLRSGKAAEIEEVCEGSLGSILRDLRQDLASVHCPAKIIMSNESKQDTMRVDRIL